MIKKNIFNKRGSSLLELVISIALISIILIFLMRLLVDLNNTETNSVYAKDNQINRAEILRMIENDLNNNIIIDIDATTSTWYNLTIKFTFKNNKTSTIYATENKFYYKSSSNSIRYWTIDGGKIYTKKANVSYSDDKINEINKRIYTLQIDIEVHTTNDKNKFGNNNLLDDILISYIGKSQDFNKNITCLGCDC